jgi:hypothetical protein
MAQSHAAGYLYRRTGLPDIQVAAKPRKFYIFTFFSIYIAAAKTAFINVGAN